MSIETIEALICAVLFLMSGYIAHEIASLVFPANNDKVSTTKQLLQYLLHSVICSLIFFPIILAISSLFDFEKVVTTTQNTYSNTLLTLLSQLRRVDHFVWFYVISIVVIIVVSVTEGLIWGRVFKKYSSKKKGLIKGSNSWDRIFYNARQTYVFIRLKQGNEIYGLWGQSPCYADSSFEPNPCIIIEQCDSQFNPKGTFIWMPKDNIAMLQFIRRE